MHWNILIFFKDIKEIQEKEFSHVWVLVIFLQSKHKWLIEQKGIVVSNFSEMRQESEELGSCLVLEDVVWGPDFEGVFHQVNYIFHIIWGLLDHARVTDPQVRQDFEGHNSHFICISYILQSIFHPIT